MALNAYITQVQDLVHDPNNAFYTPTQITNWINEARQLTALDGECCRLLIGGPGVADTFATVTNQETYSYPTALTTGGYKDVVSIVSVSVNWGGTGGSSLVMMQRWDWMTYQARLRYYGTGLSGNPYAWTTQQLGIQVSGSQIIGSFFLFPTPSSVMPVQLDAICTPIPLVTDSTPEAIPYPWSESVQYWAARKAFLNAEKYEQAKEMNQQWRDQQTYNRAWVQRRLVPNIYGTALQAR